MWDNPRRLRRACGPEVAQLEHHTVWHAVAAPGSDPTALIVHLLPVGGSGVTATARLAFGADDRLRVEITAQGLASSATYLAAIIFGTCAGGGPTAFPLGNLVPGETLGAVVPGVQLIPQHGWAIVITLASGTQVACGDVAPAAAILSPGATVLRGLVRVELAMQNGSPANGTATLYFAGPDALVATLRVNSLVPGSVHPAHIHFGSCSAGGPIGFPLANLVADPSGVAVSTTVIPGIDAIPPLGWYVNVHEGPTLVDGGATPIACGDVVTGGPVLPGT